MRAMRALIEKNIRRAGVSNQDRAPSPTGTEALSYLMGPDGSGEVSAEPATPRPPGFEPAGHDRRGHSGEGEDQHAHQAGLPWLS